MHTHDSTLFSAASDRGQGRTVAPVPADPAHKEPSSLDFIGEDFRHEACTARLVHFLRMALGSVAVLLVACGGGVAVTPGGAGNSGGSSSGSAGGSSSGSADGSDSGTGDAMSGEILGQLLITTEADQTQLLEVFSADLQPRPATSLACAGATATVGACCVFPPIPPIPTPLPGSGTGTANYGTNVGVLALLDTTSGTSIGSFDFGTQGYEGLPANYYTTRWQPGDILAVSATGDQIGAFTVSAPALSPPAVQFPSTIVATEDLKITWQPDPQADTMWIQILDEDEGSVDISCSAPDSDGTVTVDMSLFAAFKSGDLCQGAADRETVRYAQTPTGNVALKSFGYSETFSASVN